MKKVFEYIGNKIGFFFIGTVMAILYFFISFGVRKDKDFIETNEE